MDEVDDAVVVEKDEFEATGEDVLVVEVVVIEVVVVELENDNEVVVVVEVGVWVEVVVEVEVREETVELADEETEDSAELWEEV